MTTIAERTHERGSMGNAGNFDEVAERLERAARLRADREAQRAAAERPYARAAKMLRKALQGGDKTVDGPTPERIVVAADEAALETFYEPVEIIRKGVPEVIAVPVNRFRVDSGPLSRLRSRRLLHKDEVINLGMAAAGAQYRGTWMAAGLNNLPAIDPARPAIQSSSGPTTLWRSERQIHAFESFCNAGDSMSIAERRVVDAIVLAERELDDIGAQISGHARGRQAGAVALFMLQCGLASIGQFWGYLTASTANEIKGARG